MQPAAPHPHPPISVRDLPGLFMFCHIAADRRRSFAYWADLCRSLVAVCQEILNFTANLCGFLLPALPLSWFMGLAMCKVLVISAVTKWLKITYFADLACAIITHKKLINVHWISTPLMVRRSCENHALIVNQSCFSITHQFAFIELQEGHHHVLDRAGETDKLWALQRIQKVSNITTKSKMVHVPDIIWVKWHEREATSAATQCLHMINTQNMPQNCCVPRCTKKVYEDDVKIISLKAKSC